jgi:hypothetical protein
MDAHPLIGDATRTRPDDYVELLATDDERARDQERDAASTPHSGRGPLLLGAGRTRCAPPLVLTREQADTPCGCLEALAEGGVDKEGRPAPAFPLRALLALTTVAFRRRV